MARKIEGFVRVPKDPAARLLSNAAQKLETPTGLPATATAEEVMRALDAASADRDMLVLMSVALPARQRVWWACLAARDLLGESRSGDSEVLAAAEAWVFRPDDDTYGAAYEALLRAEPTDPAADCARAVLYSGGKLGPGELADMDAPPGAAEAAALTMVIDAISANIDNPGAYVALVIDRAIDLAKGGSGKVN